MTTYPWERTRRQQREANMRWPPIQPGDGPVQYALRRIAWYLEETGRPLDSLTTSELIEVAGMGRAIWYTDRPRKGQRNGTKP